MLLFKKKIIVFCILILQYSCVEIRYLIVDYIVINILEVGKGVARCGGPEIRVALPLLDKVIIDILYRLLNYLGAFDIVIIV